MLISWETRVDALIVVDVKEYAKRLGDRDMTSTSKDVPEASAQKTRIASVDKALRILELLAKSQGHSVSLKELSTTLSLHKTSVHHALSTMRERGWVEQDTEGRYRLGAATRTVADWWRSEDRLVALLHPVMLRIAAQTNELVHLGRLAERSIVYVDKAEPERPVRVWSQVGYTAPAVVTALGRAIIGARQLDRHPLNDWIAMVTKPGDRGLEQRVLAEAHRVRTEGYALEFEENEHGIACVGIPLEIGGQVDYAISVTAPIERMDRAAAARYARAIITEIDLVRIPQVAPFQVTSD